MANPVGVPHPFEPSAARGQRTSDKVDWHQSPIPALTNPPIRTQSQYYRTRLCDRFKSGFCPKGGNCNFAHTIEELRLPKGGDGSVLFPVEDRNPRNPNEHSDLINERILHQANNCRKFYNSETGPYDVKCAFAHVQPGLIQYKSLVYQKPLSWKTKICHKWQISGNCPYGDQCCYAHGDAELRKNGGHHDKFVVKKVIDEAPSNYSPNVGDNVLSKKTMTVLEESSSALEYGKEIRFLSLKKINRIYGDWIDDLV